MHDLSNTDALMWFVEDDPRLRSTIVGVLLLDTVPDWDRVLARMERVSHELPVLRRRVVRSTLNPGRLRWETAPDFDLGYHVRRITAPVGPGTDPVEAVLEIARVSAQAGFDRTRPLWEFTVVDGLPDGAAALVTKLHHVVTDGIGSVQLALHVFDLERSPAAGTAPIAHTVDRVTPPDPVARVVGDAIDELGRAADAVVRDLAAAPRLLGAAAHPRRSVRSLASLAASIGRTVAPTLTSMSPLMHERSTTGDLRALTVPLASLREGGRAAGATLNDAFLAAITGGVRRYHERHGVVVDTLRVAMPINLRTDGDAEGGNHVTILRFPVPVGEADPVERMRVVGEVCRAQRGEASLPHTERLAGVLNLLPTALLGAMMRHVDVLASNVPGAPVPLYFEGARIEHYLPFGPTGGAALNVTLMSYRDECGIGVHTDRAAVPDPDRLLECLREGFAEIEALVDRSVTDRRAPSPDRPRSRRAGSGR